MIEHIVILGCLLLAMYRNPHIVLYSGRVSIELLRYQTSIFQLITCNWNACVDIFSVPFLHREYYCILWYSGLGVDIELLQMVPFGTTIFNKNIIQRWTDSNVLFGKSIFMNAFQRFDIFTYFVINITVYMYI